MWYLAGSFPNITGTVTFHRSPKRVWAFRLMIEEQSSMIDLAGNALSSNACLISSRWIDSCSYPEDGWTVGQDSIEE